VPTGKMPCNKSLLPHKGQAFGYPVKVFCRGISAQAGTPQELVCKYNIISDKLQNVHTLLKST